ncbi:class I adenylate-forming enzyme family protein [Streptomyces asiaticus]|uniref:class I adenylate-forming enzyme family protein n=1 Tax=Streptomyces asiaticus TaxID=114695 RepID=UPI003F66F4F4
MTDYWPAGLPRHLDYPDVPIGAVLAGSARRYRDRAAVRDGDQVLTFTGLYEQAAAFAGGLRARGIRQGDVVALHLPNTLWFAVAYYGITLVGATACPANPAQPARALRAQLADCSAAAVVTHPQPAPVLAEAIEGLPVRLVVIVPPSESAPADRPDDRAKLFGRAGTTLEALVAGQSTHPPDVLVPTDSVAQYGYTGGTTGAPKGVRILHRNIVGNTIQVACWRSGALPGLDSEGGVVLNPLETSADYALPLGSCTALCVSPLFHALGLISLNFFLLCGATTILNGRFDAQSYLEQVERHRITYIPGAPALWHALLATPGIRTRNLGSVKAVVSGGAPIDTYSLEKLTEVFPNAAVIEGYGLTEATATVSSGPSAKAGLHKPGSQGVPLFDTELEIRDPLRPGRKVPRGERGEIWARGPQVASGYLGRPEETAAQFVDGWLCTGDIGHLDEDGFLYVSGRSKDMLIYKGYNVYPRELEDILGGHPAVLQASVVGREVPAVGEIPVAFVVPASERGTSAEELMEYVAERVTPYKRIKEIRFVAALPLSPAGKVLKSELRRLARTTGDPGTPPSGTQETGTPDAAGKQVRHA